MNTWKNFGIEIDDESVVTFRGERIPFVKAIVLQWEPGSTPTARVMLEPRSKRAGTAAERRMARVLIPLMRAAGAIVDEFDSDGRKQSYRKMRVHLRSNDAPACKTGNDRLALRLATAEEFAKASILDRCAECDRRFRGAAKP